MASWTERATQVEALVLDVDGVLTDGRLHYGPEGENLKSFNVRDGLGLVLLRDTGVRLGIVSGRSSPVVDARARELRIEHCLLGRSDKSEALDELCTSWGLMPERIAAIGDDLIDLPMLARVGVSFAPIDADARVRDRVDHVVQTRGGHGAVRDVCEILLKARGHWTEIARRFQFDPDAAS